MKQFKAIAGLLAVIAIVVSLAVIGVAGGKTTTEKVDTAKVHVSKSHGRDHERNVYVVETKQEGVITYSVAQAKDVTASIDGIHPEHLLVKRGDTVKLNIQSDVHCNFVIDGYHVEARTQPATTTEVMFNADFEGLFPYRCDGFLNANVGFIEVIR